MKTQADPTNIPQTEGHPEPFPEVTTMPKGWDLSELSVPQSQLMQPAQQAITIRLDAGMVVEDNLS